MMKIYRLEIAFTVSNLRFVCQTNLVCQYIYIYVCVCVCVITNNLPFFLFCYCWFWISWCFFTFLNKREMLYFDLRPGLKMLFQGDTPEGSDTFQWPVIERDRVGGLRLMIWDKVKVPLCHYSDAPEESNLWTAWQLFQLDDD